MTETDLKMLIVRMIDKICPCETMNDIEFCCWLHETFGLTAGKQIYDILQGDQNDTQSV